MSPVMFNDAESRFEVFEAVCCDVPMDDTGCDAPGCRGYVCLSCGVGCDADLDAGSCASAQDSETEQQYLNRVNRSRAVLGLDLLTPDAR